MAQTQKRRKQKQRQRFYTFTPDSVVDCGYHYHNERWHREMLGREAKISQLVISEFEGLTAEPGSADAIFLMHIRAVAGSIGNDIFNRKRACEAEKAAAASEERGMYSAQNLDWARTLVLKIGMRLGMISVVTAIGYKVVAPLLEPLVPEHVARETGSFGPSVVIGFAFFLAATWEMSSTNSKTAIGAASPTLGGNLITLV